jgi:hypothetical protein
MPVRGRWYSARIFVGCVFGEVEEIQLASFVVRFLKMNGCAVGLK